MASLGACGGREVPPSVVRIDVPEGAADIVFAPIDRVVVPSDAADEDAPSEPDASADAASIADGGSAGDVTDGARPVDVPQPVNRLCSFDEAQLNAVAVKLATCFRLSPQTVMTRLWRPDGWEGGTAYTARVCDVFRLCVALAATRGCPAVLGTCLKHTLTPAPEGRCDGLSPVCSGVRLRTCEDGFIHEDSCQAGMRECVATAGQGACVQPGSAPCAAGSPPRCEGDTLQRCVAGRWVSTLDCGRTGARCDAAGDRCVGDGAACTGESTRCDGSVLVRCRGGREHRQDCGLNVRGASCQRMGGESFCGVANDCDPSASPAGGTCEGANLTLCGGGRVYRFDCAGLGFRGCGVTGCEP